MKKLNSILGDVMCYQYERYADNRGYFFESFNKEILKKKFNLNINVFQNNIVYSKNNVLRGLHFQAGKNHQGKLVSVIEGEIIDVVVDIRKKSKNFGKWQLVNLSKKNKKALWIPRGFAHGYYTISNYNLVSYLVDNIYNPQRQKSIKWNDKTLNIKWPLKKKLPILSLKDKNAQSFEELKF